MKDCGIAFGGEGRAELNKKIIYSEFSNLW